MAAHTISWTQNGIDMDGFKVYETTSGSPVLMTNKAGKGVDGSTQSTTVPISDALVHTYFVAAYNAAGEGPHSLTVGFQATQPPAQAPTNVAVV